MNGKDRDERQDGGYVMKVTAPPGDLWIESDGRSITRVSFTPITSDHRSVPDVLLNARDRFEAYFGGSRSDFGLPLRIEGTTFQTSIWNLLAKIPYGSTITYKELGEKAGGGAIARSVGSACGSNPLPIIIPCHRVIASDGKLTGFLGGLAWKRWLLHHEGALAGPLFQE